MTNEDERAAKGGETDEREMYDAIEAVVGRDLGKALAEARKEVPDASEGDVRDAMFSYFEDGPGYDAVERAVAGGGEVVYDFDGLVDSVLEDAAERGWDSDAGGGEGGEGGEGGDSREVGGTGRIVGDAKAAIREMLEERLGELELGEPVRVVGLEIHGSRVRGDFRPDSDLDVVFEYEGGVREDDLFDALADDPMYFEGARIDFDPIKDGKTGTLEDYMERDAVYDRGKLSGEDACFESDGGADGDGDGAKGGAEGAEAVLKSVRKALESALEKIGKALGEDGDEEGDEDGEGAVNGAKGKGGKDSAADGGKAAEQDGAASEPTKRVKRRKADKDARDGDSADRDFEDGGSDFTKGLPEGLRKRPRKGLPKGLPKDAFPPPSDGPVFEDEGNGDGDGKTAADDRVRKIIDDFRKAEEESGYEGDFGIADVLASMPSGMQGKMADMLDEMGRLDDELAELSTDHYSSHQIGRHMMRLWDSDEDERRYYEALDRRRALYDEYSKAFEEFAAENGWSNEEDAATGGRRWVRKDGGEGGEEGTDGAEKPVSEAKRPSAKSAAKPKRAERPDAATASGRRVKALDRTLSRLASRIAKCKDGEAREGLRERMKAKMSELDAEFSKMSKAARSKYGKAAGIDAKKPAETDGGKVASADADAKAEKGAKPDEAE